MTQNSINHRPCQATNREGFLCLSSDTYVDIEYQLGSDSDRVSIERRPIYQASTMPGFFPYSRDLLWRHDQDVFTAEWELHISERRTVAPLR